MLFHIIEAVNICETCFLLWLPQTWLMTGNSGDHSGWPFASVIFKVLRSSPWRPGPRTALRIAIQLAQVGIWFKLRFSCLSLCSSSKSQLLFSPSSCLVSLMRTLNPWSNKVLSIVWILIESISHLIYLVTFWCIYILFLHTWGQSSVKLFKISKRLVVTRTNAQCTPAN